MTSLAVPISNQPVAGLQSLPPELGEGFFSAPTTPVTPRVAVILEVRDRSRTRWVLVKNETTGGAFGFPGADVQGNALASAIRSVTEPCCLVSEGLPLSWSGIEFQLFYGATKPHLTVYHAVLRVADVEGLEAQSLAASYASEAKLLGILAIQSLAEEGQLSAESVKLWRAYWAAQPESN